MITLKEYYNEKTTAKDDFETLTDPKLSHTKHREEVNQLVLNLVIKYLAGYVGVIAKDINKIRTQVKNIFRQEGLLGNRNNPGGVINIISGMLRLEGMSSDYMAMQCLNDIHSTAALVKEIAFNQNFSKEDPFYGIDLGTGSGILLIAMVIAAQRAEMEEIIAVGIDIQEQAVERSKKVIAQILPAKMYEIQHNNLMNPQVYKKIPKHLRYVVSETIPVGGIDISIKNNEVIPNDDFQKITSVFEGAFNGDPFIEVLKFLLKNVPNFVEKVRKGEIAMFPDVINGLLKKSQLTLKTRKRGETKGTLGETSKEFNKYEDFGGQSIRWK